MPITLPQVVIRVRQNVLDPRIASTCRPSMPLHELKKNPCLGLSQNGVNALAGPLQNEFSAERLQLSPNELNKLSPKTVMDLGSAVYQRVRPYSSQVAARVAVAIRSQLPDPSTPVGPATVVTAGGLGLSAGTVANAIRSSFFPLIRLRLSKGDIVPGITVAQITSRVVSQFAALNR